MRCLKFKHMRKVMEKLFVTINLYHTTSIISMAMNSRSKLAREIEFQRLIHRTDYRKNKNRIKLRGNINESHLKHEVVKSVLSMVAYAKGYTFWTEPRIVIGGKVVGVPDLAIKDTRRFYEVTDKGKDLNKKSDMYDAIPEDLYVDVIEINCSDISNNINEMFRQLSVQVI